MTCGWIGLTEMVDELMTLKPFIDRPGLIVVPDPEHLLRACTSPS